MLDATFLVVDVPATARLFVGVEQIGRQRRSGHPSRDDGMQYLQPVET